MATGQPIDAGYHPPIRDSDKDDDDDDLSWYFKKGEELRRLDNDKNRPFICQYTCARGTYNIKVSV